MPAKAEIRNEARFRQRLIFRSLGEYLPGNVWPTDIDFAFERNGCVLFSDFKYANERKPKSYKPGQQRLWMTLAENCPDKHLVAISEHQVDEHEDICALKDVNHFWLYVIRENGVGKDWVQIERELWPVLNVLFYRKPRETIRAVRTGEPVDGLMLLALDMKLV